MRERRTGGAAGRRRADPELVRVGSTVRRPRHPRSGFVDELLTHLEAVGFDGAPRARGYDDQGRQILTFIEGFVPHSPPYRLSDTQLLSATDLIRDFHDATAHCALRERQEVVCHGDLGPHNTVFRGDVATGLIDWDSGVRPGRRSDDFAHAVWCFADLIEDAVPVDEQARRTHLMCQAYPGMTRGLVVDELDARFRRALDQHRAAGRVEAVKVFDGLIGWLSHHRQHITTKPAAPW